MIGQTKRSEMQDNKIPFIHEPQGMSPNWFDRINKLREKYPLEQSVKSEQEVFD